MIISQGGEFFKKLRALILHKLLDRALGIFNKSKRGTCFHTNPFFVQKSHVLFLKSNIRIAENANIYLHFRLYLRYS